MSSPTSKERYFEYMIVFLAFATLAYLYLPRQDDPAVKPHVQRTQASTPPIRFGLGFSNPERLADADISKLMLRKARGLGITTVGYTLTAWLPASGLAHFEYDAWETRKALDALALWKSEGFGIELSIESVGQWKPSSEADRQGVPSNEHLIAYSGMLNDLATMAEEAGIDRIHVVVPPATEKLEREDWVKIRIDMRDNFNGVIAFTSASSAAAAAFPAWDLCEELSVRISPPPVPWTVMQWQTWEKEIRATALRWHKKVLVDVYAPTTNPGIAEFLTGRTVPIIHANGIAEEQFFTSLFQTIAGMPWLSGVDADERFVFVGSATDGLKTPRSIEDGLRNAFNKTVEMEIGDPTFLRSAGTIRQ